jgi:hypothetical protein
MRRIDLPEVMRKKTPPWQIEPRHDWHGREIVLLARGVFRFPNEASPVYHLINMDYVK